MKEAITNKEVIDEVVSKNPDIVETSPLGDRLIKMPDEKLRPSPSMTRRQALEILGITTCEEEREKID